MPSTPTPKRPRSTASTSNDGGEEEVPSSAIGYFLSSVKKSVTKRMRIGYDYLGGGGTANGQTEGAAAANNGGGDATAAATAAATPHAHRAALPRKEFGASPVLGPAPAPAAPGGIGSPPFASPPGHVAPFASGLSGQKKSGSGSASKVTRFADGKKTAGSEGKWVFCSWYSCFGGASTLPF